MRDQLDSLDIAVARIATPQHGVVSVAQLHGVGLGYHRGAVAFQDDLARDLDLRRLGFDVASSVNSR